MISRIEANFVVVAWPSSLKRLHTGLHVLGTIWAVNALSRGESNLLDFGGTKNSNAVEQCLLALH